MDIFDQSIPKDGKRKRKTRACHMCRLKKLKCDQQTPCSRCREKGLESSCSYDSREESNNEIQQDHIRQQKHSRLNNATSSDQITTVDGSQLPEILQEMQRRMKYIEGLLSGQDDKCLKIDSKLTSENHQTNSQIGRENTKNTLTENSNDLYTSQMASEFSFDGESSMYQSPAYLALGGSENEDIYKNMPKTDEWHQHVKEIDKICSLLPSRETMIKLFNTYTFRIQCFAGHFVHAPTLLSQLHQLYDIDDDKRAEFLVNGHLGGPSFLAMVLIVLALGLRYFSISEENVETSELAIRLASEEFQQIWVQSALKCLSSQAISSSSNITFIQASLFAVVYATTKSSFHQSSKSKINQFLFENSISISEESVDLDLQNLAQSAVRLLRIAISQALSLNLHRVNQNEDGLEAEMNRRVWWALCFREWTFSSEDIQNRLPSVRIGDFSTTLPKDINDKDLLQDALYVEEIRGCKLPKEMTFVRAMLQYGLLVAEQNELQLKGEIDSDSMAKSITSLLQKYVSFNETLPTFFRSEVDTSEYEDCSVPMDVQKWLLQSAVLSRILSIYRSSLWKDEVGRAMCASTARSILTLQKRLRGKSEVVDDFWINLSQSYSAAIVLCEQMFYDSKEDEVIVDMATSELIQEAILALRQTSRLDPTAIRCANILQELWQKLIKSMTHATIDTEIDKDKDSEIIQIIEDIKRHSETSNEEQSDRQDEKDEIFSKDTHFGQNSIVMQAFDVLQMPLTPLFTPNGLDLSLKFNKVYDTKANILEGSKGSTLSIASSDDQQQLLSPLPQQSEDEKAEILLDVVWNWLYEQGVIDTNQKSL